MAPRGFQHGEAAPQLQIGRLQEKLICSYSSSTVAIVDLSVLKQTNLRDVK